MKTFLIAGFVLASSLSCFARLGETIDQSITRYGQPTKSMQVASPRCMVYTFRKGEYELEGEFLDGKCVSLKINKLVFSDPSMPKQYEPMNLDEMRSLLSEYQNAHPWGQMSQEKVNGRDVEIWRRVDGFAMTTEHGGIGFSDNDGSYAYARAMTEGDQAQAKQSTSGL